MVTRNPEPLLAVRNLSVEYVTDRGPVLAIDNVSLNVMPGEILGIAGESGSGKTTLAEAVLRILPPPAVITGGEIVLEGSDVLAMDDAELRELRWQRISMVFQSAMDALNPVITIGEQIADTLLAHGVAAEDARERAVELLEMVGIPPSRVSAYAHQLSGGMRQRVGIALALALQPSLVILDEPTTALDVIVESQILSRIRDLQRSLGFAVILITHDLARMLQVSDRVAIFYAARLAEVGPADEIRRAPRHPYTEGLLNAFPSVRPGGKEPASIPGLPPSLLRPPPGCRFHPRCPRAFDPCSKQTPGPTKIGPGHVVRCHLVG